MNRLWELHRLWFNFFQPQMKLVGKVREGSKVRRRYDVARTPYQRTLEASVLDDSQRVALEAVYTTLNPAQLHREMLALQQQIWDGAAMHAPEMAEELSSAL